VRKARLLELIHDFVVFDAGIKKLCRQNQYFGVKAAQEFIRRREGGIIWHTQGSGKIADHGVAGQVDSREPLKAPGC
jgi:type I restriction enzyme R subunit